MKCRGCSSESFFTLYHNPDFRHDLPEPEAIGWVRITDNRYGGIPGLARCRGCGLVQQYPPCSPTILELYQNLEDPLYQREEGARKWVFRRILQKIQRIKPRGDLLDIGAFTGLLLDEARAMGYRVEGVEPSKWACAEAKRIYQLAIRPGILEDHLDSLGTFEIVTLLDVLEHVEHPRELLETIHGRLNRHGLLVLVTPNYGSIASKLLKNRWWHLRAAHLTYFTRSLLFSELQRAGFRIVGCHHYIWAFSLRYWLSRLAFTRPVAQFLDDFFPAVGEWQIPFSFGDSFEVYAVKADA